MPVVAWEQPREQGRGKVRGYVADRHRTGVTLTRDLAKARQFDEAEAEAVALMLQKGSHYSTVEVIEVTTE